MAGLLSQRAYAAHRKNLGLSGATHRAVQKAIEDGRISPAVVRDGQGRFVGIDPVEADRLWADQTTGSSRGGAPAIAAPPKPAAPPRVRMPTASTGPAAGSDEPPMAGGGAASFAAARAVKESYAARIAKLDYEQRAGKLIPADKVKADCFKAAVVVKEQFLNIPGRVAPELASIVDPFEVERILKQEIYAALESCRREFAKAGGIAG